MTTKIVALVDALGNLVRFVPLPGQRHDLASVKPLIETVDFDMFLADKAFDANWLRAELDDRGAIAVIPPKSNRKEKTACDFHAYRWRQLRRIATRYDKTNVSFDAMIHIAGAAIAALNVNTP